jgi:predicted aspartyl protease
VLSVVHTDGVILNPTDRARSVAIAQLVVDTGSELTWIDGRTLETIGIAREKKDVTFVMANGQHVTRQIGYAIVRVGEHVTIDEIVFAEPGDRELLGARTLEGLNLTIDPARRQLVAIGPMPAAVAA